MKYITLEDDTTTWIPIVCTTDEEIRKAIEDDCILVCQAIDRSKHGGTEPRTINHLHRAQIRL